MREPVASLNFSIGNDPTVEVMIPLARATAGTDKADARGTLIVPPAITKKSAVKVASLTVMSAQASIRMLTKGTRIAETAIALTSLAANLDILFYTLFNYPRNYFSYHL